MKRLYALIFIALIGFMVSCSTTNTKQSTDDTLSDYDLNLPDEAEVEPPRTMEPPAPPTENAKKDKKKEKEKTWKRSKIQPNTTKLSVGDTESLPLKGTQIKVQIDGFRARVLMDLYYYNDNQQQLEGTFKLKLPNEASPYFFAFGETMYIKKKYPPFE